MLYSEGILFQCCWRSSFSSPDSVCVLGIDHFVDSISISRGVLSVLLQETRENARGKVLRRFHQRSEVMRYYLAYKRVVAHCNSSHFVLAYHPAGHAMSADQKFVPGDVVVGPTNRYVYTPTNGTSAILPTATRHHLEAVTECKISIRSLFAVSIE